MTQGFASFAPAKLNLTLHVGPPRGDGFHPLASLVAFTNGLGDTVRASPADALSLTVEGPFAPALAWEADNLVLRAARALAQQAGVRAGARLHLEKRLPIASGIGGGSADAAAALRVLNALWGVRAAPADLAVLAGGLGSDIPACLTSEAAMMTGRGEAVAPAEIPNLTAVLVNPGAPAPTGAVYRAFDASGAPGGAAHHGHWPSDGRDFLAWLRRQRNDLTAAAIAVAPAIASAISLLEAEAPADAVVRLSGSGATVAAYLADAAGAQTLAAAITRRRPQWWCATGLIGSVDVTVNPV
jgi:4-diphosphocytidyl-2-C-methyl-D-erythritol kinase